MHLSRVAAAALGVVALTLATSCKESTTSSTGTIACGDAPAAICPSSGLGLGFNGSTGTPTITPSGGTSVSVGNSAYTAGGTTSATSNGWWLLVQSGTVRTFNVLTVSGGSFSGVIPLFCGAQQVYYAFTNASGTSFYMVNVTLTGCSGASGLRVQLTWDMDPSVTPGGQYSDEDLHLIRPVALGGTMNGSNDCYYWNCKSGDTGGLGLDWGTTGTAAGNPVLDVDNTTGFGPENITIASGAESGDYTVVVYNYNGSTNTHCTVRVFFNDVEAFHLTGAAMDPNRYWQVAKVNVGTRTVTQVNTFSSTAPLAASAVAPAKN